MESWSVALSFESVFENNILDFLLNLDLNQFWKKVSRGKQTVKDVQWILTVSETLTTFAPDIMYNVTWFHGVTLLEVPFWSFRGRNSIYNKLWQTSLLLLLWLFFIRDNI